MCMGELKTLKDIDKELDSWYDRSTADFVLIKLKEEAIKWIKDLEDNYYVDYDCPRCDEQTQYIVADWIKHFFNITDKDLK